MLHDFVVIFAVMAVNAEDGTARAAATSIENGAVDMAVDAMIIIIITADEAVVEASLEMTSGLLIRPIGVTMHAMEQALRRATKMQMGRHLLTRRDPMLPQEIKITEPGRLLDAACIANRYFFYIGHSSIELWV